MSQKSRKVIFNIASGLGYQIAIIVLGILMPRLYLVNFGSEVNGVLSTIRQIFAYLWLLEAGVGLATTQALYHPLATGNRPAINGILSATRRYYLRTGYVYAAAVLVVAVIYSAATASILSPVVVFTIILLNGLPSALSYLFLGKYRLLLEADGRKYVINNSDTVVQLAVSFGKVAALLVFKNLILVQAVYCVCMIIQMLYLYRYTKRNYSWLDLSVAPNLQAIAQKNSVLLHQISGIVFNNTDIILLSILCDFKVVSVYYIYNLFFSQIRNLIETVTSGLTFLLGQMFQTDRKQFIRCYDAFETIYIMAVSFILTMMALFLLPFIRIYTKGVSDINYIDSLLLMLFVMMNLLANGKLPANQVINFAGCFQETRHHAVMEAVINLSVSVVAICLWGIYGTLCGTIAALIYRSTVMIHYANRKLLLRSVWSTYRRWLVNLGVFLLALMVLGLHTQDELSFLQLLLQVCIHAPWIAGLYLAANALVERSVFQFVFQLLRRRRHP